jgi:hypothetical protein
MIKHRIETRPASRLLKWKAAVKPGRKPSQMKYWDSFAVTPQTMPQSVSPMKPARRLSPYGAVEDLAWDSAEDDETKTVDETACLFLAPWFHVNACLVTGAGVPVEPYMVLSF